MSFFSRIKAKLLGASASPEIESYFDPEFFVYIKIPEDIGPIARGEKYEDLLDNQLSLNGLGEVCGGGSQLGAERFDGTCSIAFSGIDIDVTDLQKALVLLRSELRTLNVPCGTEIHYTYQGTKLQDELHPKGWVLAQPRTFLHPGFDI